MSQLLILASYRSPKGRCHTAHDLATACAGAGLSTILLDLTPRPPRSRQRGRAGRCSLVSLLAALADDAVHLGQATGFTETPGLSVLMARPSPAGDDDDPDVVAELLTTVIERLLASHDRVVVAGPPPLAELQAAMLILVPSRDGRCDVIRDLISPLKSAGFRLDKAIADAPDILVATLVLERTLCDVPRAAAPTSPAPINDDDLTPAPQAETDDVVPRCYHLSPDAIGSLKVFSRTLSDRLGRHVTLSEIVSVAIRTSPILEQADLLGNEGPGRARIYYLRPSTLTHLTQLALLASRALGRHIRLSDVVDLAIRLFFARPLDRQVELLEANRRKREHRA